MLRIKLALDDLNTFDYAIRLLGMRTDEFPCRRELFRRILGKAKLIRFSMPLMTKRELHLKSICLLSTVSVKLPLHSLVSA